MIAAVVFDVGGVLIDASPAEAFAAVDAEHDLPPGTIASVMRGGEGFMLVETGRRSAADFWADASARIEEETGWRVQPERFDALMDGIASGAVAPPMARLVEDLKSAGLQIGLLTNMIAERRGWLHGLFEAGVVDAICDSSEVGLRKPDAAIYERMLSQLGRRAEEVAFVDDFEENVAGAQAVGMHGVFFESAEQTRRDLVALGVSIQAAAARAPTAS